MSVKMMGAVIDCGPQDRTQFCLMITLANNADDFGFAFPSLATIAANARCDEKTARRQLNELEHQGWIYVARKVLNGKCNVYIMNLERLGVTVPGDARRNPVFMRLLKKSPGAMTPIFAPQKSPGMESISTDNPQGGHRAFEQSHRAFEGGSPGIACPTNRYNRHVEPSLTVNEVEPPPYPPRGGETKTPESETLEPPPDTPGPIGEAPADDEGAELPASPHLVRSWDNWRLKSIKRDIGVTNHRNFSELVAGEYDYDVCFRDWCFLGLHRKGSVWTFVTSASQPLVTTQGIEKYRSRLVSTLRMYFPISPSAEIQFTVHSPSAGARTAA